MKDPMITVLMPVYNGERYLKIAIESILNQTYKDFELLIINDGSTDSSENIILSYKDDRIRYMKNDKNIKLIKTLNKGIDLAKGQFIARMDCDDVAMPDRLEKQLKLFQEHPDLDFVSGLPIHLLKNGRIYRSYRFCSLHTEAICFENLLEVSFCHPCIMVRSNVLRRFYYSDSNSCTNIEDYEIGRRMSHQGVNMYFSNDFVLYYRKNENGISLTNRTQQIEMGFKLARDFINATYGLEISKEDYFYFLKKKGWHSTKQLENTCKMLDTIYHAFCQKRHISKFDKTEILSWIKYRKVAYWISSFKCLNTISLYAFWKLLFHLHYLFNPLVLNKISILLKDNIFKKYRKDLVN